MARSKRSTGGCAKPSVWPLQSAARSLPEAAPWRFVLTRSRTERREALPDAHCLIMLSMHNVENDRAASSAGSPGRTAVKGDITKSCFIMPSVHNVENDRAASSAGSPGRTAVKGDAMVKAVFVCFLSLCGIDLASACVAIQRSGRQYLIVNSCPYPVRVHHVSSSGETGTTDGIPPGGSDLTPVPLRYGLQSAWCNYNDWKAGRC